MHGRHWVSRIAAAIVLASIVVACAAGAGPTASPQATQSVQPTPTAAASPTFAPTSATSPTPSAIAPTQSAPPVTATREIVYGAEGALTAAEKLDVYAPTQPGPWPVVVMFHGAPGAVDNGSYAQQAIAVAKEGFVVFVPNWGRLVSGGGGAPTPQQFVAFMSEGACAIAYARSHAVEYGGIADSLILFGHSAGANLVGGIAFSRPSPGPGCPGGESLGTINALVTWDGDWSLMDPSWDRSLSGDPSRWETLTAFWDVSSEPNLKVVVLASDVIGSYVRNLSDPAAADAFFSVRGPSGFLRGQVEALGAFDDQAYDIKEAQQLFYSRLESQGNPVTFTALPGASHDSFGFGMQHEATTVFVAAFVAAAED